MEIQIKAYAYTIDIITEIRYFCKCNNAVFGKFRIIFTCAISKTDCSLHHSFHALFKISGNEKFVRTTTLASLVKGEVLSPERIRATTGGIASVASTPSIPTTFSKAHPSPRLAPSRLPPLPKVRCCRPKKFGRLPERLLYHPSLSTTFLPYERSVGFASHCLVSHA